MKWHRRRIYVHHVDGRWSTTWRVANQNFFIWSLLSQRTDVYILLLTHCFSRANFATFSWQQNRLIAIRLRALVLDVLALGPCDHATFLRDLKNDSGDKWIKNGMEIEEKTCEQMACHLLGSWKLKLWNVFRLKIIFVIIGTDSFSFHIFQFVSLRFDIRERLGERDSENRIGRP